MLKWSFAHKVLVFMGPAGPKGPHIGYSLSASQEFSPAYTCSVHVLISSLELKMCLILGIWLMGQQQIICLMS